MPSLLKAKLSAHPMMETILDTIQRHRMLQEEDTVLVGVSGGPDSMALLYALLILSRQMSLTVGVAHLNHCLRNLDADNDEKFVVSAAETLGLPVFTEKKDIRALHKAAGISLEEAARNVRYDFFERVCRNAGFTKIAVGHQFDDNAEQVLLNLIRGCGPVGLTGIPPVRNTIIRPLIQVSRTDILDFLAAGKIAWVTDASNADETFLRNRIRHHLMPLLRSEYNPQITAALNRLSDLMQDEEEWTGTLIHPLFDATCIFADHSQVVLSVTELMKLCRAAQRRVIRKAIITVKKNLQRITGLHVNAILRLANQGRMNARLDLPDRIRVRVKKNALVIRQEKMNLRAAKSDFTNETDDFFHSISKDLVNTCEPVFIPEIRQHMLFCKKTRPSIRHLDREEKNMAVVDWDAIDFPVVIRNFKPGDRFSPLGMTGSQKLKNFFINNKIPPEKRRQIPVFLSKDQIIWVGGLRIAEPVKVTPDTKHVLTIEISSEPISSAGPFSNGAF